MVVSPGTVEASWRRAALAIALTAAALVLWPADAGAAAGDVYVADEDGLGGTVFKLGPGVADGAPVGGVTISTEPSGLVMTPAGKLLVSDYVEGTIRELDPATGTLTPFLSGPVPDAPRHMAYGPDGMLYVADDGEPDGVYRVDPATKLVTNVASEPVLATAHGIAVSRDMTAYVTDDSNDTLFRITLATGAITPLVTGPLMDGADDVVLSPDERSIFVTDRIGAQLIRVDRASGAAAPLATFPDARTVALLTSGEFLVSNIADNLIHRVGPSGSPITVFSAYPDLESAHDIVVEPPRCAGRLATVVGTEGADVLNGSAFADVFAGLGGTDTLRGLGGNDVICGGAAKDKIRGGKGKDRLLGEAGKDVLRGDQGPDTLLGGKGRDRLIGGKGKDKLRGGAGKDSQRP